MAAGANLGEKLFGMVKTIGPVFQTYAPGLGLLDLAVGMAGAVILYFVVQSKIKKARKFLFYCGVANHVPVGKRNAF